MPKADGEAYDYVRVNPDRHEMPSLYWEGWYWLRKDLDILFGGYSSPGVTVGRMTQWYTAASWFNQIADAWNECEAPPPPITQVLLMKLCAEILEDYMDSVAKAEQPAKRKPRKSVKSELVRDCFNDHPELVGEGYSYKLVVRQIERDWADKNEGNKLPANFSPSDSTVSKIRKEII